MVPLQNLIKIANSLKTFQKQNRDKKGTMVTRDQSCS